MDNWRNRDNNDQSNTQFRGGRPKNTHYRGRSAASNKQHSNTPMSDEEENTHFRDNGNRSKNKYRRSNSLKSREQRPSTSRTDQSTLQHQVPDKLTSISAFSKIFEGKPETTNNGNRNDKRPKRPNRLGFKHLEEILETEPDQLMLKLLNPRSGFAELVNNSKLSHDFIVLILRALAKMGECAFTSNKIMLLQLACSDVFVLNLTNFIMFLPLQDREEKRAARYFWDNPNNFFVNLHNYCKLILTLQPSVACNILPKLIKAAISSITQLSILSDETKCLFESIQVELVLFQEEMTPSRKKERAETNSEDLEPPDNFREMSLYPLPIEITTRNNPFLRPNIIKGQYRDVEQYLDIQFRLLREDFVKPLREGICDYIENSRKKVQNIKIYKNITFVAPYMVNAACGILVQLEIKDKKIFKKKMENSRRFMFGSLMCFTKDDFKTVIFGKIIERKIELLQNGQLVVEFEPGMCNIEYNVNYLMIESSVYFEPYYHVLKALKHLQDSNFPMKKYIVEVNSTTESPHYMRTASQYMRTAGIADDDEIFYLRQKLNDQRLGVLNSSIEKKLNVMQYQAYNSSINRSFAIIQGPPGTGKTFLGLIIAKSLLKRQVEWHNGRYPLLVVCFTNHALDQFLEGLLSETQDIVRIGGQCKNKNLQHLNIRNVRQKSRSSALYSARDSVNAAHNQLKKLYIYLNAVSQFRGIVNILPLLRNLPELSGTRLGQFTGEDFKNWLCGGHNFDRRQGANFQKEQLRKIQQLKNDDDSGSDPEILENFFDDPNEEKHLHLEDIFFDRSTINYSAYILCIDDIEKHIGVLQEKKNNLQQRVEENYIEIYKIEDELQSLENDMEYVKVRMTEGKSMTELNPLKNLNYNQPHNISPNDRWYLYFYWLEIYKNQVKQEIAKHEADYQQLYRAYEEIREIEDIEVMRQKLVIGMTTTGAARLQASLKALKSPIVIVEEAAEIMEAHVITSITEYCQHLILIGDHQQLRPNTADYLVEKKYFLGVSLFERMVNNNVHCNVLEVQHRMRPEIARLIAPSIYPNLKNHESVYNFPPIRGIDTNLYFITHTNPEELCTDNSKSNVHEATFLLQLAKYLILNGYEPEDITILAAYSGQLFAMHKERKKIDLLKDVRISILDNYQGEESRIILLSLVRNNNEGKIGFLSLENRVCVALSRAREGLYIMGNMEMLCKHSTIWPKIRIELETLNGLGMSLSLRCQIHHNKITKVKAAKDFFNVSEGGCDLICDKLLTCGHTCMMQCHILNRDHDLYKCKQKCKSVLCEIGHVCPKLCFQDCENCEVPMLRKLECGHEGEFPCYKTELICTYPIETMLPCSHTVANKPCHADINKYRCPYPCDRRIEPCGHSCTRDCHIRNDPDHLEYRCNRPCAKYRKNCEQKHGCPKLCHQECPDCDIVVKKQRSCTHYFNVKCSDAVEMIACNMPCKRAMACGHFCKLKCNEVCGRCNIKVKKIITLCQHEIMIECSKVPTPLDCNKNCQSLLRCGHQCTKKCKESCTTQCMVLVENQEPLPCGHSAKIPCYMNNNDFMAKDGAASALSYCRVKCSTKLECGHDCSGSCGECYQGRIHKICSEKCGLPLVCGHECTTPCRQTCQPCSRPCPYRCSHNKCTKKCGDICTPCVDACPRHCEHVFCTARCCDRCTVPPCREPCSKKLRRCKHDCIGFCGEPCPPLCKICNKEELLEFFLGYEDEDDARFVLLEECGHIIESRGMEMWLELDDAQIQVKRCPRCKTPLTRTRRYNNYILDSIHRTQIVRAKFYGKDEENAQLRNSLHELIMNINENNELKQVSASYNKAFSIIERKLGSVYKGRRQPMSKILGQILNSKIQILENISKLYHSSTKPKTPKSIEYINLLLDRLIKDEDRMTQQEITDYTIEIKRLRRILQLSDIVQTNSNAIRDDLYNSLSEMLYSYRKYDLGNDENIKKDIETLYKRMGGSLCVSEEELKQIVAAVGVRQGAWFVCPNGHPYAIGDCGGAMVTSKCPDCGAKVGGSNHQLLSSNQHTNMDGSRYAAWSEQANLENYDIL